MAETQSEPTTPLDLATLNTLLRSTLDALPHHKLATPEEIAQTRDAAILLVAALAPRDPTEAALAGRYVAAHHAMMEAFRCAAQPDLSAALVLRFQGKAVALSRVVTLTLRELEQRQQRPARPKAAAPALPDPRPQPAPQAAPPARPQTSAAPPTGRTPAPPPAAAPHVSKNPWHRENGAWIAPPHRPATPGLHCQRASPAGPPPSTAQTVRAA